MPIGCEYYLTGSQDLLAILEFLALPEDSLALATILKSLGLVGMSKDYSHLRMIEVASICRGNAR